MSLDFFDLFLKNTLYINTFQMPVFLIYIIVTLILANWFYIFFIYFKNKKTTIELILWITGAIAFCLFFIWSVSFNW